MKCENISHFQSDFEYGIGVRLATIDLNGITHESGVCFVCMHVCVCQWIQWKIKMKEKKKNLCFALMLCMNVAPKWKSGCDRYEN